MKVNKKSSKKITRSEPLSQNRKGFSQLVDLCDFSTDKNGLSDIIGLSKFIVPVCIKTMRVSIRTRYFCTNHIQVIKELCLSFFWRYHYSSYRKEDGCNAEFTKEASSKWCAFLFPLHTDFVFPEKVISEFLSSFPYFVCQFIHHIYMHIACQCYDVFTISFRMDICKETIKYFSSLDIIDTLLSETITHYFPEILSPDYHLFVPERKKEEESLQSVLIPKEDPTKVADVEFRTKPTKVSFHISGVSPVVSSSVSKKVIPFSPDSKIAFLYPKNGSSDWTTNLPSLLPDPQRTLHDPENFDPSNDPHSYIHRARRPDAVSNYQNIKDEYFKVERNRHKKYSRVRDDIKFSVLKIKVCQPETLSSFVSDLRKLQLDNKREETPDFKENEELLNEKCYQKIKTNETSSISRMKKVEKTQTAVSKIRGDKETVDEILQSFKEMHDQLMIV